MSLVRSEQIEAIGVIALARPDRRNALNPEMCVELKDAIARISPQTKVLVLMGDGPAFCSGFDLKLCLDRPGTLNVLLTHLSEIILALRALPIPVLISAHGAAIAGGCALLGGGDIILTSRDSKFGYPVVSLGISPAVSAPFLRLKVGNGACRERLLDTALVTGEEAHRLGLANILTEFGEEVTPVTMLLARKFAAKPRGGVAATKQWLNELDALEDSPRVALETSLSLCGTPEQQAGLEALFAPGCGPASRVN